MPWLVIKFARLKKLTSKSLTFFDVHISFRWSKIGNRWAQYLKSKHSIIT